MADKLYDIVIIGAGPAGMTAAIYAGRANKSVAIIDKDGFGGNIALSPKIENIPGFVSVSGADFANAMYEQIQGLPTVEHFAEEVAFIDYRHGVFRVSLATNETICGTSLIFAVGTKHKELKLETKNVYYCVTCDGPFLKGKSVLVVGSGNTGATYALELASYCKEVYLCDVLPAPCCEAALRDRLAKEPKVKWLPNATVESVENNKAGKLASVKMTTGETLKCSGIFAAIGTTPNTGIVSPFATLDDKGYVVSADCATDKVPGVFVAGDCRTSKAKQAVTAASDGAVAALGAIKFVDGLPKRA